LPSNLRGRKKEKFLFLNLFLLMILFSSACREEYDPLAEREGNIRSFEFQEEIIVKALNNVLKERGFKGVRADAEKGRVETEYYVQGDFRTRVVALTKKVGRGQTEVNLNVITEKRSSSGSEWEPKRVLGKAQYEKFFDEIEMECYRVLSKGE